MSQNGANNGEFQNEEKESGRTTAYGIVKQMNEELKSRGFLAVRGKVPKEFFDAKYFGGTRGKEVSA